MANGVFCFFIGQGAKDRRKGCVVCVCGACARDVRLAMCMECLARFGGSTHCAREATISGIRDWQHHGNIHVYFKYGICSF